MRPVTRLPSRRAIDILVQTGLQAHRDASLRDWVGPRHRHLMAWLDRSWLAGMRGTLGDALPAAQMPAFTQSVLLAWAVAQLRPDHLSGLEGIGAEIWLRRTSWRPLLTLAAHHGFLAVPDFPTHYRRRTNESAIDNLCGLWSVVPSTLYRYMDKGRQQLAAIFEVPEPPGEWLVSLRESAWASVQGDFVPAEGQVAWHVRQADQAQAEGRAVDALWHCGQADDLERMLNLLRRQAVALAASQETDVLLAAWTTRHGEPRVVFELALAAAALWRHRQDDLRENERLLQALRIANDTGSDLMCGRAYSALGRQYEGRDPDRSAAYYDDSLKYLHLASSAGDETTAREASAESVRVLVHLAWQHLRLNDPKALALLEQVDRLTQSHLPAEDVQAEIEQTWGEYWRCRGDLQQALVRKHRALNIYERINDERAIISTSNNLSLIYGEARQHDRALHYGQRVLDIAGRVAIDPELLGSALLHLGVSHFYQGQWDPAISHYRRALAEFERGGIQRSASSCHYNLAETYFHRFAQTGDAQDEQLGDQHAGIAMRLSREDGRDRLANAAGALKESILGDRDMADRLIPQEFAEHYAEMDEIQRLRARLALPDQMPVDRVRTHLAVANAYLAIATRERERALALAQAHGLRQEIASELQALRGTFERELTREERLRADWQRGAADLLAQNPREWVLARLFESGSINKSAYAELTGLGLATASKHLGLLAERGLLRQTGKGPATRYLLPDDETV
jgi:tetratricopeptide (TPR) repeat protein